jgi:hypothetical protein
MRRDDFHFRLLAATYAALRFGQGYVTNQLPLDVRYIALLNQSYDGNREDDEVVYPADDGRIESDLTDVAIVELVHRQDLCPQWIDISVAGADQSVTFVRLLCCGRYHSNESRMHYYQNGSQPFGIKSPDLPEGWQEGVKFELESRARAMNRIMNVNS